MSGFIQNRRFSPGLGLSRVPFPVRGEGSFDQFARRLLLTACCLAVSSPSVFWPSVFSPAARAADDGRRAVDVKRYGITVRVPQAWRLISWARDNQAFALRLPQDSKASNGLVQCELGVAPESLAEYQKREDESARQPPDDAAISQRQLLENALQPLDAAKFGERLAKQLGQRLLSVWQIETPMGDRSFEVRVRIVVHGTLYTFTLNTDEAHFEAYRLDFDEMLASAVFTPPETGLERLPGGMWMQRDFRFALRLPPEWKPAFGPSDKVLFFAAGASHDGLLTDNLVVRATVPRPLPLEELKNSLPAEIVKRDAKAQVTCRIVPQGGTFALETKVQTVQGKTSVTTLERRFRSRQRNYEVQFTCETSEFEKLEAELQKTLDSFTELVDATTRDAA